MPSSFKLHNSHPLLGVIAPSLLVGVNCTLKAVVEEEPSDRCPSRVRRIPMFIHGIHSLLGHGGVEPCRNQPASTQCRCA